MFTEDIQWDKRTWLSTPGHQIKTSLSPSFKNFVYGFVGQKGRMRACLDCHQTIHRLSYPGLIMRDIR